jgi:hypothetical protein
LLVARAGDVARVVEVADDALELVPHRLRRLGADLLADDRAQQRGIAARRYPRFGITDARERRRDRGFADCEFVHRGLQLVGVQAHTVIP